MRKFINSSLALLTLSLGLGTLFAQDPKIDPKAPPPKESEVKKDDKKDPKDDPKKDPKDDKEKDKAKLEKIEKDVKSLKEKFDKAKLEINKAKVNVTDETYSQLATWGNPGAGYNSFGVKLNGSGTPLSIQKRFGPHVLNSDGNIAFLGNYGTAEVILAPSGSQGFGYKNDKLAVVYVPYVDGVFGTPVIVAPVASEAFPGFYNYHHGASNDVPGYMVILK